MSAWNLTLEQAIVFWRAEAELLGPVRYTSGGCFMAGKGDKRRVMQVKRDEFDENWDKAFTNDTPYKTKRETIPFTFPTGRSRPNRHWSS